MPAHPPPAGHPPLVICSREAGGSTAAMQALGSQGWPALTPASLAAAAAGLAPGAGAGPGPCPDTPPGPTEACWPAVAAALSSPPWSLGFVENPGPAAVFRRFQDRLDHGGLTLWWPSSCPRTSPPHAAWRRSGSDGGLRLHPGRAGCATVLRFTAPQAGHYTVMGAGRRQGTGRLEVRVVVDGAWDRAPWQAQGDEARTHLALNLAAGATVDLVVAATAPGPARGAAGAAWTVAWGVQAHAATAAPLTDRA